MKSLAGGRWLVALAVGGLVPGLAVAQDSYLFSLSGTGQAAFGDLEDQEVGRYDVASAAVRPWLRTATGAFFTGDETGDGWTDEWSDVDALSVTPPGGSTLGTVYLSLLSDLGSFKDGDILTLDPAGYLETLHAEIRLVQDFGITDGNCDVDAFHHDPGGTYLVSFAENENSSVLSTDGPGVIADGALLSWTPATGQVGVVYSEGQVDGLVSTARASATAVGDLMSVSKDASGTIHFSVQSPSSDDGSVFTDQNGGTLVVDELTFGFANAMELNALSVESAEVPFPVAAVTPRTVPAGTSAVVDLWGEPSHQMWLLFTFGQGDAGQAPGAGFHGLYLDPTDPLLYWTLGASWLKANLDATGTASLPLPVAPAGFQGTVWGQVFDATAGSFGTPIAVDFN